MSDYASFHDLYQTTFQKIESCRIFLCKSLLIVWQASTWEVCDRMSTPLVTPKTSETCSIAHLVHYKNFYTCKLGTIQKVFWTNIVSYNLHKYDFPKLGIGRGKQSWKLVIKWVMGSFWKGKIPLWKQMKKIVFF